MFRLVLLLLCFNGLLGPLGGLWGLVWEALGGHLWSLGVVLGEVSGRPWEFLRAAWAPKRPRCSQDGPKSPPQGSRRLPKGVQKTSRTATEAFSRLQMASNNVSKGPSKKEKKTISEPFNRCRLSLIFINFCFAIFVRSVSTWHINLEKRNLFDIRKPGAFT